MLKKLKYYFGKLWGKLTYIFSWRRIRKFGLKIAVLDFISFMCHRSASDFQLMVIRAKDRSVQKYIHKNYENVLEKYRER